MAEPTAATAPITVQFTLDGTPRTVTAPPKQSALSVLRGELGAATLRPGCTPQGICGSCAAVVNGKVRLTCTLAVKTLAGKELQTLDGLEGVEEIAASFAAEGALQCGACLPGILTQTATLLTHVPEPDDAIIRKALQLHLCRCTGWEPIRRGIKRAAAVRRGETPADAAAPRRRLETALGRSPLVEDLRRPGMLHAVPVVLPDAAGTFVGLDLDVLAAREGVHAVLAAADLPEGVQLAGRAPLLAPGTAIDGPGAIVALVLATDVTAALAAAATARPEVEAVPAPTLDTALDAAESLFLDLSETRGSPDAAATVVVKHTVHTAAIDPAWIEPEAALAVPGPQLSVWSNAARVAPVVAAVSALSEEAEPRVVLLPNGGAFGGRASGETAALAAWAAVHTERPVRLCWTHETATLRQRTRPATRLHLTLRATPSGELTSLELDAIVDGGATPAGARATADGLAAAIAGPYTIPHLSTRVRIVRTGARATVGLRGAGLAQATYARETALDTLAEALGTGPTDLRQSALAPEAKGLLDDAPSVLASLPPRTPDAGAAAVVVDDHGLRLDLGVGDDGQGLHDLAASQLAAISGVPEDLVRISATEAAPVPAGSATGILAAVEAIADELAASLADEDHDLSALIGRRFQRTLSPDPAPEATACAHVVLDDEGRVASLQLTLRAGPVLAATTTAAVATGGAHMGVGMAVNEGVHTDPLGSPDPRLRSQGVLKEKQTPPIHVTLEPGPGPWVSPDEQAALAMAVVPAAMARAVAASGGATDRLPMCDNPVAKGLGIRPPRPYVRKR